ncbi:hypothetical protein KSF_107080 [Reticulibacter mediterranei]|uniref:Uncharacterized protein n=1 Tax=Reticulibacter mediterranei TaxID=2778369 RepID=A0A8J3N9J5_9CHLR|nr:hypothetical protein KSF_107080 [Reticulibacter mediterranei]
MPELAPKDERGIAVTNRLLQHRMQRLTNKRKSVTEAESQQKKRTSATLPPNSIEAVAVKHCVNGRELLPKWECR